MGPEAFAKPPAPNLYPRTARPSASTLSNHQSSFTRRISPSGSNPQATPQTGMPAARAACTSGSESPIIAAWSGASSGSESSASAWPPALSAACRPTHLPGTSHGHPAPQPDRAEARQQRRRIRLPRRQ